MGQSFDWRKWIMAFTLVTGSLLSAGCSWLTSYEKQTKAQILPTVGHRVRGTVTFVERADGLQITYNIAGLPPASDHAFQIHELGDCNAVDASSTGDIFALGKHARSSLRKKLRPAGRLPNIRADLNGVATGFIVMPDLALDGIRSVINRSIVVLKEADDPHSAQPVTSSRLGCGVIRQ